MITEKRLKKQITIAAVTAAGIFAALAVTAIMAFITLSRAQKNEAEIYLNEVTEQYKSTIVTQMEGYLHVLEALSTILGEKEMEEDEILDILEIENYQNDFIRMGFVGTDGIGELVDMDGVRYENVRLGEEEFIQDAMKGNRWFPIPCGIGLTMVILTVMGYLFTEKGSFWECLPLPVNMKVSGRSSAVLYSMEVHICISLTATEIS